MAAWAAALAAWAAWGGGPGGMGGAVGGGYGLGMKSGAQGSSGSPARALGRSLDSSAGRRNVATRGEGLVRRDGAKDSRTELDKKEVVGLNLGDQARFGKMPSLSVAENAAKRNSSAAANAPQGNSSISGPYAQQNSVNQSLANLAERENQFSYNKLARAESPAKPAAVSADAPKEQALAARSMRQAQAGAAAAPAAASTPEGLASSLKAKAPVDRSLGLPPQSAPAQPQAAAPAAVEAKPAQTTQAAPRTSASRPGKPVGAKDR